MASLTAVGTSPSSVVAFVKWLVGSKLLLITVFGLALIAIGRFLLSGTLAGMFGIWGATFVLIGIVGWGLFHLLYRPD